jgi:hypothetical protein
MGILVWTYRWIYRSESTVDRCVQTFKDGYGYTTLFTLPQFLRFTETAKVHLDARFVKKLAGLKLLIGYLVLKRLASFLQIASVNGA